MEGRVGVARVAEAIGRTTRNVRQLAEKGVLTTAAKDADGEWSFDLAKSVEEYHAWKSATDASGKDWRLERDKQDARIKKAKAEMLELELDEMKGRYHRAEFVRDAFDDLIYAVRSSVLALPGKLAPELAEGKEQTAEFAAAIERECKDLLEGLSRYEYSADYYRERLRDENMVVPDGDSEES